MKRVIIVLCSIAVIVTGIVISLPFLLSTETVRTEISNRLQELTGREVSFRGDLGLSFKPFLAIELSDLEITDDAGGPDSEPLLTVDTVQAQLQVFPALVGNVNLDNFRLLRPRLNLKIYPDGKSNWHFQQGSLFEAYEAASEKLLNEEAISKISNTQLGTFTIVDGAIRFEDTITGRQEDITSMNGLISWKNTNADASFEGLAIWRGENINSTADITSPMQLFAGGESEISIAVQSTPVIFNFSGIANMLSNLFFSGKLELSTPSTDRLADILQINIGDFGSLVLDGDVEATSTSLRINNASIGISDNQAEGVLSVNFDELGDSKIDGTLAFGELDFSQFLGGKGDSIKTQVEGPARSTSIDLRVSANAIDTGIAQLENVAAIVTADDSGWIIDIGDSAAFGGSLIAKFGEKKEEDKRQAFFEASSNGSDAQQLSSLFQENKISFEGEADISVNLKAKDIPSLIMRSGINGSFEASLTNGNIDGFDLASMLDALNPNENETTSSIASLQGSTTVNSFSMSLFLNNSIATVAKSSLKSAENVLQLLGRIDFRQGNLSLRGQQIGKDGPLPGRIFLGGTLIDPLVSIQKVQKSALQESRNQASTVSAN